MEVLGFNCLLQDMLGGLTILLVFFESMQHYGTPLQNCVHNGKRGGVLFSVLDRGRSDSIDNCLKSYLKVLLYIRHISE